jgi:hypothetical protein
VLRALVENRVRWGLVLVASLAACEKAKPSASEITGTLVISGKDVSSKMECKPGGAVHISVDIVTPEGTLRFEDQKLSMNGEVLRCDKLDRDWNGGRRPDGSVYWRGKLAFDCAAEPGRITGDLDLACVHLTLEERAALDNADRELDEQLRRNAGSAPRNDQDAANRGSAASGSEGSGSN